MDVDEFLQQKQASDIYIFILGGRLRGRTLGSVEKYSFRKRQWELCPNMLENRGSHGSASVGSLVYTIGGGGFHTNLSSNEIFDTQTEHQELMASMKYPRHALAVVAMNVTQSSPPRLLHPDGSNSTTNIFAIGGWIDGSICSAECERYDTALNKWFDAAKMNLPRRLLGATGYGESNIFVFGGKTQNGEDTAEVEVYDTIQNTWTVRKSMPIKGPCSAVTVGGYIYVVVQGKSVLRYSSDPANESFTECSQLPLPQWFCFSVTCFGPQLFLQGGKTGKNFCKVMYAFDTRDNSWKKMPDMLRRRRRCSAAVVVSHTM